MRALVENAYFAFTVVPLCFARTNDIQGVKATRSIFAPGGRAFRFFLDFLDLAFFCFLYGVV